MFQTYMPQGKKRKIIETSKLARLSIYVAKVPSKIVSESMTIYFFENIGVFPLCECVL